MKRFQLHRVIDATGVSGTGVVAEGVEFSDGTCALRWLTQVASTGYYRTIGDVTYIHGHEGQTKVIWIDSD
jgi:hypothetical protein